MLSSQPSYLANIPTPYRYRCLRAAPTPSAQDMPFRPQSRFGKVLMLSIRLPDVRRSCLLYYSGSIVSVPIQAINLSPGEALVSNNCAEGIFLETCTLLTSFQLAVVWFLPLLNNGTLIAPTMKAERRFLTYITHLLPVPSLDKQNIELLAYASG